MTPTLPRAIQPHVVVTAAGDLACRACSHGPVHEHLRHLVGCPVAAHEETLRRLRDILDGLTAGVLLYGQAQTRARRDRFAVEQAAARAIRAVDELIGGEEGRRVGELLRQAGRGYR